ncbi:putative phage protein [Lauvirus lau218]|uniref:Putative phage protein n=1 Tax=Lauvirus lau218 TaxID=1465639 RepID=A0A060BKZ3_9CAUD|nr:putative phage protein [Lauvirus lau218]
MKTIQFYREESNVYQYTIEVEDDFNIKKDDPFNGEITNYKEMIDTNATFKK